MTSQYHPYGSWSYPTTVDATTWSLKSKACTVTQVRVTVNLQVNQKKQSIVDAYVSQRADLFWFFWNKFWWCFRQFLIVYEFFQLIIPEPCSVRFWVRFRNRVTIWAFAKSKLWFCWNFERKPEMKRRFGGKWIHVSEMLLHVYVYIWLKGQRLGHQKYNVRLDLKPAILFSATVWFNIKIVID